MPRQKHISTSALTNDASLQRTRIPEPPLSFSDTAQKLDDIVVEHPPHCVIQCASLSDSGRNAFNSNFDLNQPLLAYMTRTVRKVSAHSLTFNHQRGEFVAIGNGILIPEDYPGWFAVMGSPSTGISQQSVSHYTKLSLLAAAKCSLFLVGGKDPIHGLMVQNDEKGKMRRTECSVLPGTVLRKAGLYREEKQATKEKQKKKKSKDVPQREFLKCFDDHDREMLIYTRQEGTFYIVAKDEASVSPRILQMKDILRYKFPLVVKLIYGRVPTTPCAFTQVLLLTDRGLSRTLVASTVLCYKNINVEIPLGTELKFRVARNTSSLLSSQAYVRALEMCKEQAPSYIKDMKVVFGNSQLALDGVARCQAKTNQQPQVAHTSQSLPGCNSQVSTHKTPADCEIPEQCPVSSVSRMSVLSQMSDRVVVSHDTFVMADLPSCSQTKTADKEGTSAMLQDTSAKISPITAFNPPRYDVINVNPGPALHRSPTAPERCAQPDRMYDNNSHLHPDNSRGHTENIIATSNASNSLPSSPVIVNSNGDHSNDYQTLWEATRVSTINIPSKVGRPVIPGRSPVDDFKQFDYVAMQAKLPASTPKPHLRLADLHKAALSPTSEAPPIPPRPRIQCNYSESSSVNDSDSFTSLSEDSWSLSDWATDEECNYINMKLTDLKRVENPICENDQDPDQERAHSEDRTHTYLELENVPDTDTCSTAPYSQWESNDQPDLITATSGYIQPYHVDYQKSPENGKKEHSTDPGYSQADTLADSGVFDDERGYSQADTLADSGVFDDERGYSIVKESPDVAVSTQQQPDNVPQLPPRPPQAMTLGQAVLRAVPGPSQSVRTQVNKEMLVSELRKAGIKPATEIALAGLKVADIINILGKDDEFDDDLFALLPQVGLVELKRIAACVRSLKVRI